MIYFYVNDRGKSSHPDFNLNFLTDACIFSKCNHLALNFIIRNYIATFKFSHICIATIEKIFYFILSLSHDNKE